MFRRYLQSGFCYATDTVHKIKIVLRYATNDIKQHSFDGVKCYGKLVHVYDGDTFKAVVYNKGQIQKLTFRPVGYDTPEMRPPRDLPDKETHIAKAHEARRHFITLCGGIDSYIFLRCGPFDKYGRVLVQLYRRRCAERSINDMMLDSGLAKVYTEGKKTTR
jgi:endonuclease YncB( thermonuclease family)